MEKKVFRRNRDREAERAIFERELRALEERIGYRFARPKRLREAMQHSSYLADNNDASSNERLEFLGDRVLELCVGRFLFDLEPPLDQGRLTKERSWIVDEDNLAKAAEGIGLAGAVRVGQSLDGKAVSRSILADAMEALIGAVYVDGGLPAAERLVRRFVLNEGSPGTAPPGFHSRNQLQEACRRMGLEDPIFAHEAQGPGHEPTFVCVGRVGEVSAEGRGRTKKEAERDAAARLLEALERRR